MIVYKCDLCKEVCRKENLITIKVPTNKYSYATTSNNIKLIKFKSDVKISPIEICPECATHIANFLDSLGISS